MIMLKILTEVAELESLHAEVKAPVVGILTIGAKAKDQTLYLTLLDNTVISLKLNPEYVTKDIPPDTEIWILVEKQYGDKGQFFFTASENEMMILKGINLDEQDRTYPYACDVQDILGYRT